MTIFRKNVSDLSIDEILGELRDIARLEEKKTIRGDLRKRKGQLRARLKRAEKSATHV